MPPNSFNDLESNKLNVKKPFIPRVPVYQSLSIHSNPSLTFTLFLSQHEKNFNATYMTKLYLCVERVIKMLVCAF